MPVSRVYLVEGTEEEVLERVKAHSIGDKVAWSAICQAYRYNAPRGTGAGAPAAAAAAGLGTPAAPAQTVTLVSFSDSPNQKFAQTGEDGEMLQCHPQIDRVMDLIKGRYRLMRTVKLSGVKLGLGDFELKVGTVPASQRSESAVTIAELKYHPSVYEDMCGAVLQSFADAVLPPNSTPATEFLKDAGTQGGAAAAATTDDGDPVEFDDRRLVLQYLAVLREKKAL